MTGESAQSLYARFISFEVFLLNELKENQLYSSLICGGVAGLAAKTVIAPAERVKMSFQVALEQFSWKRAYYRATNMVQQDGILSLWRGHSTTVMRIVPYAALSYAFHDYAEAAFKRSLEKDKLPAVYKFLAGAIGGAAGTLLTYPLDVLRVRIALDPEASYRKCLRKGVGLYQGIVPTMVGIVPYSGVAWSIKQTSTETFISSRKRQPFLTEALAINAFAGVCGQFVTYPLDIARRRMQIAHASEEMRLKTFREVLWHMIESEGVRGISKGFSLNVIKGPIALSISLTTYDFCMNTIKKYSDNDKFS